MALPTGNSGSGGAERKIMEDYAAKMAGKPDAELLRYLTHRAEYREVAVLAALNELARRGQAHPDDARLRPELEAAAKSQAAQEDAARPEAPETASAAAPETAPALYSPLAIAMFSILPMSTMIGGGVLLGINLFRLRRLRALLGLVVFVVGYLLIGSQLLTWAIVQQGFNPYLGSLLFNIPAVLAYLLWFWPRYITTPAYRTRSLLIPVVVCFAVIWGMQKLMPYLIEQQPKEVRAEIERLMKR
ncbi:hypothetical protein F0P96_14010 [Hymenobacter busanensis]|uniref:Uncharacterized protein n=1 Tax=Hymenobacter busanensis TaxID=2607656 RepID=A0A7L5A3M4_9BACT|nr:hypothetical protein [Hymenobacter busanensis]KAA9331357.1 hypothetical protein F0P96_14010 [Hymenobacter busanensis]QHJ08510.1 hypothetical protein GUY19_14935 [Hymenobacter busanensis]